MNVEPIQWGILGCGDVTEVKGGPAAMNREGRSRVVACMRRDGGKAADYARRHSIDRSYDQAAELIADPSVNAIYIATPPGSHRDLALQVAQAGKPCYVEKPMARFAKECDEMNAAFAKAGVPIFVAYYRRSLPRFVEAKRLIAAGELGDVTGVHYELARSFSPDRDHGWRTQPDISGGGLFLDLGSHLLDLLDHLLGPLESVAGNVASHGDADVENVVAMSFQQPGGICGTARWNFAAARDLDQLTIEGTAATLSMSCFGNEPLQLTPREGETKPLDFPHGPHVQEHLMTHVIAHLLGEGECPSTGESAARTNRVMDRVLGRL